MLKRILSAFLLCLCVSPVWAGSCTQYEQIYTTSTDQTCYQLLTEKYDDLSVCIGADDIGIFEKESIDLAKSCRIELEKSCNVSESPDMRLPVWEQREYIDCIKRYDEDRKELCSVKIVATECASNAVMAKDSQGNDMGRCDERAIGTNAASVQSTILNSERKTPVTECADTAKVALAAGETCPGDSNEKINVTATVKDIYSGEALMASVFPLGKNNGAWTDADGKFSLSNIPKNTKLRISYSSNIIFYVCASELQNKSLICANSATDLDNVTVYACAGSVLHDLNASDGKPKQDEKGTWCDIECPNGYTRQEKIQTLQFRDRATGNMIDSPQRYICVANGDVTTDNTATPTPGGEDNSGATAPAKPDGTPCTPTDKNAKSGKYQNGECIIVECNGAYYKVSDDKKSCVEDKKAKSQAKIDELQKNADAMKEKEQSTANKLLGGAAIGATGIGAMQAASAYSEQAADEEAETAMRAYLATFHCNYGGGINVKGGEKDVQLPGGNELIDLYAEYVNLANNLKVRKAALDMRPGIESEAILDSATSGLYDDVAIGKTSGAFTSLARALQDPTGEDAKAWAAQKDDSAKKMKTGLTMAGIGAIGGAVGNLIINKDAPKENSKEILDKYKDGDLTGKVSKSPDGTLVAEPVIQEGKPEPGIVIQDKDLGQETNMNQNQSGNWVNIVKFYEVGFYCEDLFDNVYRSCFAMNNDDYARFQQSKFSEITNNAERCYQRLVQCKQESHTLARVEEACIRAVASEFSIDMSGANNADCTDNLKTDFTWKSHIFQEQSTVNADASVLGVVADAVGLDLGEIGGLNNPIAPGADITDQCYVRTVGHGNEPFGFVLEKGSIKECYSKYYYEGYDADDPLKWVKKNLAKINANRAAQGLGQCSGGYVTSAEFENLIKDYEKICRTLSCKYQHMYRGTNRYKKDDASSSSTWYYTYNGKEYPLLLDANDGCDNPDDSELDYYFFVHTVSEWENEPTTAVFQPVCLFSYGPDTFTPVKFERSKQEEWVEAKLNLSNSSVEYEVSARHDLYVTTKRNTSGKGTVYMGTGGILVMPITNDYKTYLGCPD